MWAEKQSNVLVSYGQIHKTFILGWKRQCSILRCFFECVKITTRFVLRCHCPLLTDARCGSFRETLGFVDLQNSEPADLLLPVGDWFNVKDVVHVEPTVLKVKVTFSAVSPASANMELSVRSYLA